MFLKKRLAPVVLAMSLLAFALRYGLYTFGLDEKGLLIAAHPMQLCLWALTAVAVALAVLLTEEEAAQNRDSRLEALGEFLAAVGIALALLTRIPGSATVLDGLLLALCVLAAAGLGYGLILRRMGRPMSILSCAAPCLFFAVYMVCNYRVWSARPQLQDWFFPAMGAMTAMIFAYLRCVPGRFRLRRITGLLGCFACFAALGSCADPTVYLGAGLWMITNLHAPGDAL